MLKDIKIPPQAKRILAQIPDPEIPVLSILDLGIVRQVNSTDKGYTISITPTYSGCPAMDTIRQDIIHAFNDHGIEVNVENVLDPSWSTDWISEEGKEKLKAYGIAPPLSPESDKMALLENKKIIQCPHCGSQSTQMISQFGSTPCKALFRCDDCLEPFDYFKCL